MKKESTFNIEHYSDGILSEFSNEYGISLNEAVDELIYYNMFSEKYSEDSLLEYLEEMEVGYQIRGTRWSEIKITKK